MATGEKTCVLILGHSFVQRIERFLKDARHPMAHLNYDLPDTADVTFYGIGGRRSQGLCTLDSKQVAHLISLEIGSNDLHLPFIESDLMISQIKK